MITELVKFKNRSGLFLDGLYFYSPMNCCVVINVHGSFGNFYSNAFIKIMAESYNKKGINFLSFNLTQHDGVAEGVREQNNINRWEYIGYAISDYSCCIDDIAGAYDYVKIRNNNTIILQGHSLGCNRILYYIKETGCDCPIILLSPTNSLELQRRWIFPERIEEQIFRLTEDGLRNEINFNEHGVNTSKKEIDRARDDAPYIPISAKSLVTMLKNPSMDIVQMLNNEKPVDNLAFVYIGGQDEYQTDSLEIYRNCFDRYFSHIKYKVIIDGNHSFIGHEEELANCIAEWVNTIDYDGRYKLRRQENA